MSYRSLAETTMMVTQLIALGEHPKNPTNTICRRYRICVTAFICFHRLPLH